MPLSKKRQAEYQKERRNRLKIVIPKTGIVIPSDDALQSISRGIKRETDSTAPPVSVQPSDDIPFTPKDTRTIRGIITSRRRGEFLTSIDDAQPIPNCPDGRYRDKGG